jgi:hypothetical protein
MQQAFLFHVEVFYLPEKQQRPAESAPAKPK